MWHWNASSTSTKRLDDNEIFFALSVLLSMEHIHMDQVQEIVFIFDKKINMLEI